MKKIPRMTVASWGTLLKRVSYGGRKGRSAARRIARVLEASNHLAKFLA
jgi:hypothetical protein